MDTIFALASAQGKAGVSVLRLSGTEAWASVAALTQTLPPPRHAGLRKLRHRGETLDEALIILFESEKSYTGEEVAELHLHGSPAIVRAVMRVFGEFPGHRIAEPGEFSRRALENGRLDLSQVEGLSDLIEAETEAQRRQAMRAFAGGLGDRVAQWRSTLMRALALLSAAIDFSDEDLPGDIGLEIRALIVGVTEDLKQEIVGVAAAERVRDGFEVAILGAPNVGKSTLLNTLAGREAALTSEIAGTTRDVIEVRMDIAGLAVTMLDTAGLRASTDVLESMGMARALDRATDADLRVVLSLDGALPDGVPFRPADLLVRAKADLSHDGPSSTSLSISGKTGEGVSRLVEQIGGILGQRASGAGMLTRERHREAVVAAIGALEFACNELDSKEDRIEFVAEKMRVAVQKLDILIGRVDVEDVLGEIFARFCIGK